MPYVHQPCVPGHHIASADGEMSMCFKFKPVISSGKLKKCRDVIYVLLPHGGEYSNSTEFSQIIPNLYTLRILGFYLACLYCLSEKLLEYVAEPFQCQHLLFIFTSPIKI